MERKKRISCMVVDDDPAAIRLLTHFIDTEPYLQLVATETDAFRAFHFLRQHPVDLLFLDVDMPGIDGVSLAKALIPQPHIILTTGFPEYAMQGFEIGVGDCIPKPVTLDRFALAVNRTVGHYWRSDVSAAPEEAFFLHEKTNGWDTKVYYADICYIESFRNDIHIHLPTNKLAARMTLKEIEQRLPQADFIKIHRSFIVAYRKIYGINRKKKQLQLQAVDKCLPIGDFYWEELMRRYKFVDSEEGE